jgi:hypothetical protein
MLLEQLESRRLLAGNVTVTVVGGALNVIGDNKSNQIDLEAGTAFAGYTVTGLNGTKVNGGTTPVFALVPPPNPLTIDLGNGDDSVRLHPAPQVTFDAVLVNIDTGNGSDSVTVEDYACEDMTIDTGNGGDDVHLTNVFVFHNLHVDLGNGSDSLTVAGALEVDNDLALRGGNGPDVLDASGLTAVFLPGSVFVDEFETFI